MEKRKPDRDIQESSEIVIGFHGYGPNEMSEAARSFEDEVLALLPDHGGRLIFRGTRRKDQPEAEPLEFHVLWFPGQPSLDRYLADERRDMAMRRHGEVFTEKRVVFLDALTSMSI